MFLDKNRLRLNPNLKIEKIQIAEGAECCIVDDVYQDPHYIREVALSLDFNHMRSFYPGYDAMISLDSSEFRELFSRLAERNLRITDKSEYGYLFSQVCEDSPLFNRHFPHPHVDMFRLKNRWKYAATLFLNLPQQCAGGTAFYRHIESGIVKFPVKPIPEIQRLLELHEKSSLWELNQDWMSGRPGYLESAARSGLTWGLITETNDQWEKIYCVEMKFNRLAFYDAMIFHCPHIRSGDFKNTHFAKRLTQQFFLAAAD